MTNLNFLSLLEIFKISLKLMYHVSSENLELLTEDFGDGLLGILVFYA